MPVAKGIGYGMVVVSFLVMIYYNLVIAYSFHYLFSGFQKILPWTRCDAWWNSPQTRAECLIINSGELSDDQLDCSIGQSTNNSILFWKDNSTFQQDWIRVQHLDFTVSYSSEKVYAEPFVQTERLSGMEEFSNLDTSVLFDASKKIEPAEEYWFRRVLRLETDQTDNGEELYTLDNLGGVLWDLVGCNALTWLILFFCLFRGVKSSGKVRVNSSI